MTSATGGAVGYACPTIAKDARLCWAAVVTNNAYSHSDGSALMNILHHYSVATYRTDQATTIVVSPNGSANPTMTVDTDDKKAYYLNTVQSTITPVASNGMNLWSRKPENENGASSVISTTDMTCGVDVGGSIGYSNSEAIRTEITLTTVG